MTRGKPQMKNRKIKEFLIYHYFIYLGIHVYGQPHIKKRHCVTLCLSGGWLGKNFGIIIENSIILRYQLQFSSSVTLGFFSVETRTTEKKI